MQEGITETNHGVVDYLVVTSTEFWDELPDDVRSKLEQIFAEVTAEANANSDQLNQEAREEILASGESMEPSEGEVPAAVLPGDL